MAFFSNKQKQKVETVCKRAEEVTGEYFQIPSFGPEKYLYEVATLRDAQKDELAPGHFAHLIRYLRARPGPGHIRRPGQYYRILLQDEEILESLKRKEVSFGLEALLFYVLTHELIHVVRFERFQQALEIGSEEKEKEECIVHSLTGQILTPLADKELNEVLGKYRSHTEGMFCLSGPSEIHLHGQPPTIG